MWTVTQRALKRLLTGLIFLIRVLSARPIPKHKAAAQEFWRRCDAAGDIYKKFYRVKYCVGCELEKTDSEIEKGRCPLHPGKDLEIREEENYFSSLKNTKRDSFVYTRNAPTLYCLKVACVRRDYLWKKDSMISAFLA